MKSITTTEPDLATARVDSTPCYAGDDVEKSTVLINGKTTNDKLAAEKSNNTEVLTEKASVDSSEQEENLAEKQKRNRFLVAGIVVLLLLFAVGVLAAWAANQNRGEVAIGRPFLDYKGKAISATTMQNATTTSTPKLWSASTADEIHLDRIKSLVALSDYSDLANEWKQRALGEHASIASFGAVAILLMTHQAPPDLIDAALVAARDELRHATTSFEMASLLLGGQTSTTVVVEPSALPPSEHKFEHDFHRMAIGVAEEGCIMETLSALQLAAYVDENQFAQDEIVRLSAEKTAVIAQEEATHSALAWKTVHWVCTMDSEACAQLVQRTFNESNLKNFLVESKITISSSEDDAWNFIHSQLVPLVTGRRSTEAASHVKLDGDSHVAKLARLIVENVQTAVMSAETLLATT